MGDFKEDFRDGILSAFDLFGSVTINDYKKVVKRDNIKEAWATVGKELESTFQRIEQEKKNNPLLIHE